MTRLEVCTILLWTRLRVEKAPPAAGILPGIPYSYGPDSMSDRTTHFGFRQVPLEEKARQVRGVFDSVADKYDVMNDLMSLGIHRLWKRFTLERSGVRRGQRVLDIASGTGDLAARFARMVGPEGEVVVSDINASMLEQGRRRLLDQGVAGNIEYVQADAERLPFPDNHFDCVSIAFGLRNVTDKDAALREMYRVLRPAGRVLILEFSQVTLPGFRPLYDLYSFRMLPLMGKLIANDAASYQYLAESIRMHPDQETLKGMMQAAGFERAEYHNLSGGIVALHRGYKL
ncbi:ubiquinone/menaquinone biosynthesis C-methyltransferase UbiE [Thiohalobacter sp. COW1]|uniref:Ubiquinone/menaquinone biosynthesis C-methyltransferase UbiE n=2 Tax=Thiohalobacteraceae TaxID=3085110 RepID=A0A1Z4VM66_9GAMM|nr:ubiquinone/menaquinone biosynthesis methyltransferase [Thiohalobacter thiocyanaticus]BCO32340.1 ubiquinone/menaquinone biosynthesis C-methyltransferase UbiE [Thiohalobacter sp. COW1]